MWTMEGLLDRQAAKLAVEAKAAEFEAEKLMLLQKSNDAPNLWQKVMRYRDAVEAAEKHMMTGVHHYQTVPRSMEDVVAIQTPTHWTDDSASNNNNNNNNNNMYPSGVVIGNSGLIWRTGTATDSLLGGAKRPMILGECHIKRMYPENSVPPPQASTMMSTQVDHHDDDALSLRP
jgi:hypothetical protein